MKNVIFPISWFLLLYVYVSAVMMMMMMMMYDSAYLPTYLPTYLLTPGRCVEDWFPIIANPFSALSQLLVLLSSQHKPTDR